jgi:hypothetical protein
MVVVGAIGVVGRMALRGPSTGLRMMCWLL